MQGIASLWNTLSPVRRVLLVGALVATVAAVLAVAQMARQPRMALLFPGLEAGAAGEVIARLEQMGVPSEVRGPAIYVPASERDRVRMALASEGLPAADHAGYELLDGLSGFGTTAEMFDAAYWRAKEGELARTLLSAPDVARARVHIGVPSRRTFSREERQPSAAVTLQARAGRVGAATARAARTLVALAVPGLGPEQVAVIDARGGVLLSPGEEGPDGGAQGAEARSAALEARVRALVLARVGDGNARVSVNVETRHESETVSSRSIDPDSRTLRETETMEMTESGSQPGGAVTVASDLPDGDAAAGGDATNEREEARRTDRFDYAETRRETVRPAGEVERISVAVLVNGVAGADGTLAPRPREELAMLEKLVRSAVGYDEARGDVVTVESIAFAVPPELGTEAGAEALPSFVEAHMLELVQLGVLVLVVALLGLVVVRPVLAAARPPAPVLEADDPALSAIDVTPRSEPTEAPAPPPGLPGEAVSEGPPDPLALLREQVAGRIEDSGRVLQGWLEADEVAKP